MFIQNVDKTLVYLKGKILIRILIIVTTYLILGRSASSTLVYSAQRLQTNSSGILLTTRKNIRWLTVSTKVNTLVILTKRVNFKSKFEPDKLLMGFQVILSVPLSSKQEKQTSRS